MKKILLIATMASFIMISGNALSHAAVEWKGFQWNAYQACKIKVNDDGHLVVQPTHYNGGAAYYSTPIDFRSAKNAVD